MFRSDASEFVYVRTYSRWIEEKKRRETWPETVDRYINFLLQERPNLIPDKVISKIRKRMLAFEVLPSMRAVWSAGEAARQDNTCMYNCSFDVIDSPESFGVGVIDSPKSFAEALYILMCGTGYGFSVEKKHVNKLPIVANRKDVERRFIIEDSRQGWAESVNQLIEDCYNGIDTTFDYSLLRLKGERLLTMGGRSSGPQPLIDLHEYIKEVFLSAQGRQLTSLECHDILNQIAESVVVGGVRRSSQMSLSDLDDTPMRHSKDWPFPSRRNMANNSAVFLKKPSAVEFLKEWGHLAASGTGERGIFNLQVARDRSPERRNKSLIAGTNPCVTGDTEILTNQGYLPIERVVNKEILIWNGFEWSKVVPKVTGYNQEIITVKFSDGRHLNCTPYHKFHIANGYTGTFKEVEAKDLTPKMKLIKHKFPILVEGKKLEVPYLQGFHSAEGMEGYDFIYVYEPKYICLDERLRGFGGKINSPDNYKRIKFTHGRKLLQKSFVPVDYDLESKLQWLAGLFDGDGCELKEGGCQLASVDRNFLTNTQKLLSTLGIQSKISLGNKAGYRSMPNGNKGNKEFYCQDIYRICIGAIQMQELKQLGLICERLTFNKTPQRDASQFVSVVSVEPSHTAEKVYCFNEPLNHTGIFNGVITGQCSEILLRAKQFCNLSEIVVREDDDLDTLMDKIETAVWVGAIQSTFTYFPNLRPEWKINCEEERLLGVSITGQMDNPKLLTKEALRTLKQKALKVAKHASQKLNINLPAAITCVKPSGTVSQLVDSASGLHPRYAKYYIRRYRISETDPLLKMLKDQGIKLTPENGQENLSEDQISTYVIDFPIKAPKHAITRDKMNAIQQLEWYKKIQQNWCEHNASMTVYVKDNEWFEVGNWVYKNWNIVNGVSFLPYDGGRYKLAPYEEITKEQYEKLLEKQIKIDYTQLSRYELEDNTEGAKSYNCTGDRCDIV